MFIETKSGGGDLGVYGVNNVFHPNSISKNMIITEQLDEKLYGNNRHELDALRVMRLQLNLSEISECDDSTDTENITLSRVQEITQQEIARFELLAQSRPKTPSNETKSSKSDSLPPIKRLRLKSPSVEDRGAATVRSETEISTSSKNNPLRLSLPSSICDGTSTEVSPYFSKDESVAEESSVGELKQLTSTRHKSDTELCKVHILPKFFRSERTRPKQTPKILDLELLSSIHTTAEPSPHCTITPVRDKRNIKKYSSDSTSTAVEECTLNSASSVSPETERLSANNISVICTGLDVPLKCRKLQGFPAITKITTNVGTLDDSSRSSHDFECIYDTGYGDIYSESPKEEHDIIADDDYVSYKHIAGDMMKTTVKEARSKATPEPSAVEALRLREAQSTELPFYDVASSNSSEGHQTITLVSESEDVPQERSSFWSNCFCCNLLLSRRNDF